MRNFQDQDWQNVTTANFKDLFLGLKMPLTLNSRENKASQTPSEIKDDFFPLPNPAKIAVKIRIAE